ncbi:MAG TPA: DNA repair protein RadC [Lachnospiraceae bacterium]|nr:DNA repair protein RadC [Lachnospiraceae bacterium]
MKNSDSDLPYEKFIKIGPENLTDAELLAIIVRTGVSGETPLSISKNILSLANEKDGLLGLHHVTIDELMSIKGIGEVKAIKIKCLVEFSNRFAKRYTRESLSFQQPESVAAYYMEQMRHLEKEQVVLVLLDGKNRLLEDCVISIGTINCSLMSPREIFKKAIKCNAVSILLLHNHPSGDPTPSKQDILMTKRMKEASALIEIPLLDHIIIGDQKYTSFKDKGLI